MLSDLPAKYSDQPRGNAPQRGAWEIVRKSMLRVSRIQTFAAHNPKRQRDMSWIFARTRCTVLQKMELSCQKFFFHLLSKYFEVFHYGHFRILEVPAISPTKYTLFTCYVPFISFVFVGKSGQITGQAVVQSVEAPRYKPQSRGFHSRWWHWNFWRHNPSGRTMALRSTQPLRAMSISNISWGGKGGPFLGLATLPHSCADCLEIWEPQLPGTLRACPGL